MRTDLERIRELEAKLRPLLDANWLCAIADALKPLHEHGFRAAGLDVFHDGTPSLRDGAIDFFIEGLAPEQEPTVNRILDSIEEAYGVSFHCESQMQATQKADSQAFASMHYEWICARNVTAVVSDTDVQKIDLKQLNTFLLSMATDVRREGQQNLSDEERTAMLDHPTIPAKAIEVMVSRLAALAWMNRPALGLDRQRPAALFRTIEGVHVVKDFLARLHHGVYT